MFPKSKLKLLYIDILRGYSTFEHPRYRHLYLKHFTTFDVGDIDLKYESYFQKAVSKGLPTMNEKKESLIKDGFWETKKDDLIIEYNKFIEGLKLTKSKVFRAAEIDKVTKQIEEHEKKVYALEEERARLIGFTAELFAARKINEYNIFNSLFKDSSLESTLFTEDDFNEMDEPEVAELIEIYNKITSNFNEVNLKRISLYPTFFNLFGLSENAFEFYGKPIIQLTFYQVEVYSHARYFKSLFSTGKKPPENLLDEPDKLVEWYESSKNAEEVLNKNNTNKDASSLMGLSKEDRERLGVKNENNSISKLVEAAKNNGGELNMSAIMKAIN